MMKLDCFCSFKKASKWPDVGIIHGCMQDISNDSTQPVR